MKHSRRVFLKKSSASAVGLGLFKPDFSLYREISPNEKVNLGLIGARNKGFNILSHMLKTGQANCLGICDVDRDIMEQRIDEVEKTYGQVVKSYNDFRKMLDNKKIDAVIIGTPDHWHCLMMVLACQAGKDVYVEKPLANSIEECNLMLAAARKYNRVVQVGQQQRSGEVWNSAMAHIHAGGIGEIKRVNVWANFPYGMGAPKVPDKAIPKGLDYDFWQGPASKRTYNPNRVHGNWRHFWDYGGGLMTDWGVHLLDMALWAKSIEHEPKSVIGSGANYNMAAYCRETFELMDVSYPMEDFLIHWSHTAGIPVGPFEKPYGVEFIGDKGAIIADRGDWKILLENKEESDEASKLAKANYNFTGKSAMEIHVSDFIKCVKERTVTNCPVEIGRNVALYAHMGNIAVRSGENVLEWNAESGNFKGNSKGNALIQPEYHGGWKLPTV